MKTLFIISVCATYCLLACSNTTQSSVGTETANDTVVDTAMPTDSLHPEELPLPSIPDTMREPALRASYLIQHFWDAMDFSDTLRAHSSAFMEQNFANFVSVFPYADEASRRNAVSSFLNSASTDLQTYQLITSIAEHYLYDPNSPMLDEETYILFLEQMVTSPILDSAHILRLKHQLRFAKLNRPGMTAADFTYLTRDGDRTTLHRTDTNELLLLVFYDPDCEHCQEVIPQIASSSILTDMVNSGRLKILAIYADMDSELWKKTNTELPTSWIVGMDTGNISNKNLYALRALPSLYLLDSNKTVLLKDAPISMVENYMRGIVSE
ncbi:MAG: DUF5106 domain-containing protein [Prevotellaceae bacterium]|nr:DUF5106 domain-containing protein [Prevotellaceae bacterium]